MGRGDKKSRKGKIAIGSYGVTRNRKRIKAKLRRVHSTKAPVLAAVEEKPKAKRASRKKETAE